MRQRSAPVTGPRCTPTPTRRRVHWSMTTSTQSLRSTMDSHRKRSTLHRLSVVWPMNDTHEGPVPPGMGRECVDSTRYTTFLSMLAPNVREMMRAIRGQPNRGLRDTCLCGTRSNAEDRGPARALRHPLMPAPQARPQRPWLAHQCRRARRPAAAAVSRPVSGRVYHGNRAISTRICYPTVLFRVDRTPPDDPARSPGNPASYRISQPLGVTGRTPPSRVGS